MQKWALQDGAGWSLTHAFYANLRGFVVRFPPPSLPREGALQQATPPNSDIEANRSLSDSAISPSKKSTPDQPIKPSGIKEATADVEWKASPPKQQKGRRWCPFRPAYCPCQNKGRSSTFEYISLETIRAHSGPFRNGKFRVNPFHIKMVPPDADTGPISQALCDYANRDTTTPWDFIALCEKVDRYVFKSWVCIV